MSSLPHTDLICLLAQAKAQAALNGRKFGSSTVQASWFDDEKFTRKDF
jgi:hypothetical protein